MTMEKIYKKLIITLKKKKIHKKIRKINKKLEYYKVDFSTRKHSNIIKCNNDISHEDKAFNLMQFLSLK